MNDLNGMLGPTRGAPRPAKDVTHPRRVSRRKLAQYSELREGMPWFIRAYVSACEYMRLNPYTLSALPEVYSTGGPMDDTVVIEGTIVPAHALMVAPKCPGGPAGCLCRCRGGARSCRLVNQHFVSLVCPTMRASPSRCTCITGPLCHEASDLHQRNVGTFSIGDFAGSPQQHAILNRHLLDYFRDRQRSQETTRYAIPASQLHLLPDLGMEPPQPDAPVVPHGLHKSIEEGQLHRMRNYLVPNDYNLICVKRSKVPCLPPPASVQNPVRQAKDASRFPGSTISDMDFSVSHTHFIHDVTAEVTPHELVEKLAAERPDAHLFATGMNPAEVVDRVESFEPASHMLEYDGAYFNYVFSGSASESYRTPIDVTLAWIHTSSVVASNGRTYHVVLLDNKLGHCLYHIFCGDVQEQDSRTYSTGSFVRLPPAITGTLRPEYLPAKFLTAILEFVRRTTDLSTRNLAAKVTMVANATNPKTTARERWVAWHVMSLLAPYQTWDYYLRRWFWTGLYALTLQWQMLAPIPDLYNYLRERERHMTILPTQGGGWSRRVNFESPLRSIPNNPTMLQRLSAFTASAFVFLWPKLLVGEALTLVFLHADLWHAAARVVSWLDIKPLRLILTLAILVSAAVVPNHVLSYFTRLSSHFWRQLWWPGYLRHLVSIAIVELSGAPGARVFVAPGGGWAWQALLWAVALHSVLPGLVPALVVPWIAFTHGWTCLMAPWLSAVVVENLAVSVSRRPFHLEHMYTRRHRRTWNELAETTVKWESTPRSRVLVHRSVRRPLVSTSRPRYTTVTYPCRMEWDLPAPWAAGWVRRLLALPRPKIYTSPNLWNALLGDLSDLLYVTLYAAKTAVNWTCWTLVGSQAILGNCGRVPTVQAPPAEEKKVVRRRNIDKILPATVLQPMIPVAPPASALAIPPDGLSFPDWLGQVEAAYQANPRLHPQLTPGQDCFWQAVSSLGGDPHMWFCWFMEFMRRQVPANQGIVGGVKMVDMHMFAAVSGIGIRLSGVTDEATLSRDGRPTLSIRITHVPASNDLHAELATVGPRSDSVQTVARIVRTFRQQYPAWANDVVAAFANAPQDSVPTPTPTLRAIAGDHPLPNCMQDIADSLNASFDVMPFNARQPDGYSLDMVGAVAQGDPLFEYLAPVSRLRVARTTNAKLWEKYREKAVGATPRQQKDNATGLNVRPEPAMWVTLMNELRQKVSDYSGGWLPATSLEEEVVEFTADVDRAARLVSDLKAHPAVLGGKASAAWLQSLDSVLDLYRLENRTVTVPVRAYFGVSGCGKTTATVAYLNTLDPGQRQSARIVSHTESLRAKAKLALDFPEFRGVNFPTIPGVLSEPSCGPIVFDDAGKFFGGILDLVLLTNPLVPEVVVNGDPAQGLAKFPIGGTQSEFDPGPLVVAQQTTKYATISYRMFTLLARTLGVHTTNPTAGHITHTITGKAGIPVTTTSPRYVQVLSSAGRQAYTHDTIQGEDFDTDVEVDMSALEEAISDRSAYVALTRSKRGVYLHMNAADPRSVIKAPPTGSDLLNAILYTMRSDNLPRLLNGSDLTRAAFYAHLHSSMPNLSWFANVGATLGADRYQSVVVASNNRFVVDFQCEDPAPVDWEPPSTAYFDHCLHETHHWDKEDREVARAGIMTDQFKEVAFVNPHVHKRGDHATYKLTVEKRITNATPAANYTRKMKCPRLDMINEFHRLVPNLPKWSPAKHEHYVDLARVEYEAGRTEAQVQAKLDAHDPDRSGGDVVNSLKAQVNSKAEKRVKKEAIPGQLIYEYDIAQTLEDAAYALFLENELFPAFPDNFLFYRRMNPQQFIDAYKKRWRVGNGVHTSDVTRWDVGCDAGVLNFDEDIFRSVGFPPEYVDRYVERRLATRSQHGWLQTGQPSGDRYTWTLNSMRRAIVASLVLQLQPEDTVAINGDDEALDRCADALPFPDTVWEFKDQNGPTGEFSGFELGGPVPTYSASGIHYRTMILVSRDPSAQEKWVNYMELLKYADHDTMEALDVANLARQYMRPELFQQSLPKALRPHFPDVFPNLVT